MICVDSNLFMSRITDIFQSCNIEYLGRTQDEELLEYKLVIQTLESFMYDSFLKYFPFGSKITLDSIESNIEKLVFIVTISKNDYKEFFETKHSELILNDHIVTNLEDFVGGK